MKKICLAAFLLLSAAGVYAYNEPSAFPLPLTGCKRACFNNVSYTAPSGTSSVAIHIQKCAFTPREELGGGNCLAAASEAEFASCMTRFCPFIEDMFAQTMNYEANVCISTPVPGESVTDRVLKCVAGYNASDAAKCSFPRPQNMTALASNAATFRSAAGPGYTPEWQMSPDNGQSFVPAAGGIAPTFSFSAVPSLNGKLYRAAWRNTYGAVPTEAATLTVLSQSPPSARLFVSNGGGQGMVEQYDAWNGAFSNNFAPVYEPRGIIVDPADGALLVASAAENQILKFNGQTGTPLGVFVDGTAPCGGTTLNRPAGIVIGPNAYLYVADSSNNRVVAYHGLTGACVGTYASGPALNQPNGLAFGQDGYLYVANLAGTVARFAPGGGAVADTVSVGTSPAGIAISPLNDNLYVTDRVAAGQVFVIARNTFPASIPSVFVSAPAGGLVNPEGLVFGPGNQLYVASKASSQVQRFHGATGALLSTHINNVPAGLGPAFLAFGPSMTASGASATYSPVNQSVTLSASVTNSAGPANTGTVVFSVFDVSTQPATQIGSSTSPAAVSNGNVSATFTLPGGTPAGPYSIRATYSESGNFGSASDNTKILTVNQATPVINWNNPASIPFGSALSGSQLNATANVPGAFIYTPPAGTVLSAGNGQSLSVQFNPADSRSYRAVTASVLINVTAGGPATLVSTSRLAREPGTNNVIVTMNIANTGASPATAVRVTSAAIGATASTTLLPVSVANVPAGATSTVQLVFPASVGIAGSRSVLSIRGDYSGGSFTQSARVVLP